MDGSLQALLNDPRLLEIALCLLAIGVLRRIAGVRSRSTSER
jgi:hypothetical protein